MTAEPLDHERFMFPARPADVPHDVALDELLAAWHTHQLRTILARQRLDEPGGAASLFDHATAALALSYAITDRLSASLWSTVRDALAADASRGADVAAACGLTVEEVAVGLCRWADGQHAHGLMDAREHGVVVLLARGVDERAVTPRDPSRTQSLDQP